MLSPDSSSVVNWGFLCVGFLGLSLAYSMVISVVYIVGGTPRMAVFYDKYIRPLVLRL